MLLDARNKYDGTRRSPWNEVECGDHYTRPMSGFLLFEIASGQVIKVSLLRCLAPHQISTLHFLEMECTHKIHTVCS